MYRKLLQSPRKKNDFTLTIIKQALKTRLKPREARASKSLGLMQCSRVHCAERMEECGMLSTALLLVKDLSKSNLLGSKLCWPFLYISISNGETKALKSSLEVNSPVQGGEGKAEGFNCCLPFPFHSHKPRG